MRVWTLIKDTTSDVGEGVMDATNVSVRITGEVDRRKGLTLVSSNGAISLAQYFHPAIGYGVMAFTSAGSVVTVAL